MSQDDSKMVSSFRNRVRVVGETRLFTRRFMIEYKFEKPLIVNFDSLGNVILPENWESLLVKKPV